jgi:hypothetical protein
MGYVTAFDENTAAVGVVAATDAVDQGSLARPVRANDGQDLPCLRLQAHIIQGPNAAELTADMLDG